MKVGGAGVAEGSVLNVTIGDLEPDTLYTFTVTAINSYRGRSLSDEREITHRTKG